MTLTALQMNKSRQLDIVSIQIIIDLFQQATHIFFSLTSPISRFLAQTK